MSIGTASATYYHSPRRPSAAIQPPTDDSRLVPYMLMNGRNA